MDDFFNAQPFVEFLILAERAEAVNGKLYMMGGGWDRLWVRDFAQPQTIWIAVAITVPWTATNEEHRLHAILRDQDEIEMAGVQFGFRAGASAQMERTESQKVLAALQLNAQIERPGMYTVHAMVDDDPSPERSRRTTFYAKQRPAQA